ncbi:MAG TPA: hypothetical protein VK604_17795 [Bryobacteraceae bacterium]|nr:hypothetical protein [Bryobacteraceae bacterium]
METGNSLPGLDERRIAEGSRQVTAGESGGHQQETQKRMALLQISQQGESEVGFEMALMKLVENDDAHVRLSSIG